MALIITDIICTKETDDDKSHEEEEIMKMIIKMGVAGQHLSNDPPPLPDVTCYSVCSLG